MNGKAKSCLLFSRVPCAVGAKPKNNGKGKDGSRTIRQTTEGGGGVGCQRAQWLDHASTVAAAGVGRGDGTTTAAGGQTGSNDVHTQHHRLTKKVE